MSIEEFTGSHEKRALAARQVENNPNNEKAIKETYRGTNNLESLMERYKKSHGTYDVDRFYQETQITVKGGRASSLQLRQRRTIPQYIDIP
jgi:hypothetical protein